MTVTVAQLAENTVVVDQDYFDREHDASAQVPTYIAGPVSDDIISKAERQLRVQIPSEYRRFLSTYGAMLTQGLEIAGLTPYEVVGQPFFRHVVEDTENLIRHCGDEEDHRYLLISSDGMGINFLLDTAEVRSGCIIARGPGVDDIEVADGLDEFCDQMLKDVCYGRISEVTEQGEEPSV